MRATPATGCSNVNNSDWIRAIVRYEGAEIAQPTSQNWTITDMTCVDEDGLVPYVPMNVGYLSYGDQANISLIKGNYEQFTMGGTSLEINWEDPTLMLAEKADPSYPAQYNVLEVNGTDNTVSHPHTTFANSCQWIYFVVQSVAPVAIPHPLHLHGHDFLQIAKGTGVFNESCLENGQFTNPLRRDVMTLPASAHGGPVGGYMVIAFPLNNPGVWVSYLRRAR
jgi:Multicopper oxidase